MAEREPCPNGPDCKVCRGQNVLKIAGLARQAKEFSLHLVTDADLEVLKAMARSLIARDEIEDRPMFASLEDQRNVCSAELARRGEKP